MPPEPKLILASASTTRSTLLRAAGLAFEARPAGINEDIIKRAAQAEGATAAQAASRLANAKAAGITAPGATIIGCDQILVCDGTWFDKPPTLEAARRHLKALRGQTHHLETATTLWRDGQPIWHHHATPRLRMRDFSNEFLEHYLDLEGETLLTSVGAYRLEGPGIQLFAQIDGAHSAILGLPLLPLLAELRRHGLVAR